MTQVAEFTYNIYAVPDNLYGVYDHQTEEWNGIVRELMDRKADIAVAPMTINFARLVWEDQKLISLGEASKVKYEKNWQNFSKLSN